MAAKIKKGDKVFIISGKDKGKEGEVTRIIKSSQSQDKALVQGINLVKRHRKPSQDNPGGIISEERPIQITSRAFSSKFIKIKLLYAFSSFSNFSSSSPPAMRVRRLLISISFLLPLAKTLPLFKKANLSPRSFACMSL